MRTGRAGQGTDGGVRTGRAGQSDSEWTRGTGGNGVNVGGVLLLALMIYLVVDRERVEAAQERALKRMKRGDGRD